MEAANNQIEGDLFENIKSDNEVQTIAPVTDPTHAFIAKHIHPPSATPSYEGMPTNDSRTQVVTNWVDFRVLDSPAGFAGQDASPASVPPSGVDGFAFLATSGLRNPIISFVHNTNAPAGWNQDLANTKPLSVYDVTRLRYDATLFRPAYRSLTTYLNATMFNNVGAVASAQFNPPIMFAGPLYALAEKFPKQFDKYVDRRMADSKSTHIEEKHIKKFPSAMQDALRKKSHRDYDELSALSLDPNTKIQFVDFGKMGNTESANSLGAIVPTLSQIMNLSTRSYGGKAVDGTFNVHRLNTLTPEWLSTNDPDHNKDENSGLFECWMEFEDPLGNDNFAPFASNGGSSSAPAKIMHDVQWTKDQTWSWIVYSGLLPNSNLLSGSGNADLLILKLYIGTELQAAALSPWAGMQKLGPRPNMAAMQALIEAYYDLKDCMPAKYNFAGLATVVGGAIRAVGRGVFQRAAPILKKAAANAINETHNGDTRRRQRSRARSQGRARSNSRARSSSRNRPRSHSRGRRQPRRRTRPVKTRVYVNTAIANRAQRRPLRVAHSVENELQRASERIQELETALEKAQL